MVGWRQASLFLGEGDSNVTVFFVVVVLEELRGSACDSRIGSAQLHRLGFSF